MTSLTSCTRSAHPPPRIDGFEAVSCAMSVADIILPRGLSCPTFGTACYRSRQTCPFAHQVEREMSSDDTTACSPSPSVVSLSGDWKTEEQRATVVARPLLPGSPQTRTSSCRGGGELSQSVGLQIENDSWWHGMERCNLG